MSAQCDTSAGCDGTGAGPRAEDVETFGTQKARFQALARSNARSAAKSMQSILTRRIFVSGDRAAALLAIQQGLSPEAGSGSINLASRQATAGSDVPDVRGTGAARIPLLLLDFAPEQVTELKAALHGKYDTRTVSLLPRDWAALIKTTRERFIVPDHDVDEAVLAAIEEQAAGDGRRASKDVTVTGAPPQVRLAHTVLTVCC